MSSTEQPPSLDDTDEAGSKSVLIIAYHFPPAAGQGLPGTQRAVKLIRYLPEFGWNTDILTVNASKYPGYIELDPDSVDALPPGLRIERTGATNLLQRLMSVRNAVGRISGRLMGRGSEKKKPHYVDGRKRPVQSFKDSITELFEIPDEVAGWIGPATISGRRLIRSERPCAIIATGRPWSSLVIGSILSSLSGLPLVSDLRDPWMTNPFRADHSKFKDKMDSWLESYVVRRSSLIIANTDLLRDEFAARYSHLPDNKFVCIPNGFDSQEIGTCLAREAKVSRPDQFSLVHAGFLYGKRDPKILIDALRTLVERTSISANELQVILVGPRDLSYSLSQYIDEAELTDYVQIIDAVPFQQSLEMVATSSAALLLQPDTLTQVPSKLFENIGLGKMTIAIADAESATERLFRENQIGYFADCVSMDEIAGAIHDAYRDWKRGNGKLIMDPDVQAQFDIRNRVQHVAEQLDRLTDDAQGGQS